MGELFELRSTPELESPVMIVALDGWIDAGLGGATALAAIVRQVETSTIAEFDADYLLDHRARRPTMRLENGINAGLTWPTIELQALTDLDGNDAVLLVGYEPDHAWRAFSDAVTNLALELGVRLVTGLGAYPAPVPHTRPTGVVSTATTEELARQVGSVAGRIDVPAGVLAAIERCCADHGLPAVGLWAQVPHYAAAMPYPAAAAALVTALDRVCGLRFDAADLTRDAEATKARLDELVSGSVEHIELVRQLEQEVDAVEAGEPLPGHGRRAGRRAGAVPARAGRLTPPGQRGRRRVVGRPVDVGPGRELDDRALHLEGVGLGLGQLPGQVAPAAVGVAVLARLVGLALLVGPGGRSGPTRPRPCRRCRGSRRWCWPLCRSRGRGRGTSCGRRRRPAAWSVRRRPAAG